MCLGRASGKSMHASESVTFSRGVEVLVSMQSQTCFGRGSGLGSGVSGFGYQFRQGFRSGISGVRSRVSGMTRFRVSGFTDQLADS